MQSVVPIGVLLSADYRNPFVEIHPEHPQIIYVSDETKTVVVPCRVTSPEIKPKLTQVSDFQRNANKSGLPPPWVKM